MRSITITSRLGEFAGRANDMVALFDKYDDKAGKDIRHYILLKECIKLMYEPWGWENTWYADLIQINQIDNFKIEIIDLCLDIVIEGHGPTYRMIDFDDLADALTDGRIQPTELKGPLYKLQRFLDDHLHGLKDFPPSCIKPFMKIGNR